MSQSRVIFMGRTGSGKTTLCQKLDELELKYKKTQSVEVYNKAIDTPGEYLEHRHFYKALIMSAVDAEIIVLVGDPLALENYIPPSFAGSFAKELIGVITKINLVTEYSQIQKVEEELWAAGVSHIFKVDTVEGIGIEELFAYLDKFLNKEISR
jgi:ethanolamine utilization protein EutP